MWRTRLFRRRWIFSAFSAAVYLTLASAAICAADEKQHRSYEDFHKWYMQHSILSLIVDGEDPRELDKRLKQLQTLAGRGVIIGDVLVLGTASDPLAAFPERFAGTGIVNAKRVDAASMLKRFGAQHVPTWIVRYQGVDYVFDGVENPEQLFSAKGVFRAQ